MVSVLPNDLLVSLQQQVACRQAQLRQLSILYNTSIPSPNILVCNGLEDTGKLESVLAVLESQKLNFILVKSKECLSQRHLVARIFTAFLRRIGEDNSTQHYDRVDNVNALVENLRKLLRTRDEKIVLVLDGADEQKGATATLLPALARLGEVISCLSVILITSSPKPVVLHKTGVFNVHFPPYTRAEAVRILLKHPISLVPDPLPSYAPEIDHDNLLRIYQQFVTTVYDSLTSYTTTSIRTFRRTCEKLWPRFIWPLMSGELPPRSAHSTGAVNWDFARLLSRNRTLFQTDGERALRDYVRPEKTVVLSFEDLIKQREEQRSYNATTSGRNNKPNSMETPEIKPSEVRNKPPLLKHFTTLVLLAAYLASHSLQKHDIILFSRLSSTSTMKRRYLNKSRSGGITKTPTKSPSKATKSSQNGIAAEDVDAAFSSAVDATPSKKTKKAAKEISAAEATTPKKERADRSMRAIFDRTSNVARPFTLERLIAIIRAIHPDGIPHRRGTADRVYMELAELERLKLVVRATDNASSAGGMRSAGGGTGDLGTDDIMEEKWRVNVGREWVQGMGKVWGVGLEGWEIE